LLLPAGRPGESPFCDDNELSVVTLLTLPDHVSRTDSSFPCLNVVQTNLAPCRELLILGATDLHLPKLLCAPLLDRDRAYVEPAGTMRPQKVSAVGDANGLLPAALHRLKGARSRERLDRGRVQPAVNKAPWLMVALVRGDRAAERRSRARQRSELRGS
jgi:hypothetical protein